MTATVGTDHLDGAGPDRGLAPASEVRALVGLDRRPEAVAWSHVLPLAVVLAFGNGFWIISLRGAVGAIERTSAPFSSWLRESTILVPVYVVAVLAAFALAQRRFGPRPRGPRALSRSLAAVVMAGSAAGTLLLLASSWFDYVLQRADLHHMGTVHPGCDPTCVAARVHATFALETKAVWLGFLLMLVTDLILVGLVTAFRGGELLLARPGSSGAARPRKDARLLLAAGLAGAAVIHAAVLPQHFAEWRAAGAFFGVLAMAELAAATAVLAYGRARRVPALWAAVVVSAGPLLLWAVSRSSGLPFGPRAGVPEAVGGADVMSCLLELAALAVALILLRRDRPARSWDRHVAAIAWTAVLAATLIGLGATDVPVAGVFSSFGGHHTKGAGLPAR